MLWNGQIIAGRKRPLNLTKLKRGFSNKPEHQTWKNMLQRCYSPKDAKFQYYGGKGITVCEEWRKSYLHFLNDMGLRPSNRYSIDRINPTGIYEPSNCRWLLRSSQNHNRVLPYPKRKKKCNKRCLRCNYAWFSKLEMPKVCSHCGQFSWNKPRTKKMRKDMKKWIA